MNVNRNIIEEVANTVSKWQRFQARAQEGLVEESEFEDELDSYLKELERFEKEYGMSKIGEGRDRITFTSGRATQTEDSSIVKVSKGDGGRQNREEIEIWKQMEEDAGRKCVAHLIDWDSGYSWIVQERVSQGAPPGSATEVAEMLEKNGWTCSDVSPDNVGLKNGNPVLIDLGVGLRRTN